MRARWAAALLAEVSGWRLRVSDVPADVIQQLRAYDDPEIAAAAREAFGAPAAVSTPEKAAEIERLTRVLAARDGDPSRGKAHFTKRCAACHALFGEGGRNGPELDPYDRGNLAFWLPAIVEPSIEIREGFESWLAITKDARLITGTIAAQGSATVTLRSADGQTIVVARDEIRELRALETSLMPEDLLAELSDDEIADLFAYLSASTRAEP
jgi:putative heme-binding domain-containing protein